MIERKLVYVDMDGVMCDYNSAAISAREKYPNVIYPQALPGFFLNMLPIENAIQSVNRIRQFHDVYVLTAPSVDNPLCYTEKRMWVGEHFDQDMVRRLVISPNKSLLKGDYLIDDHVDGRGQDRFEGQLLHFGSTEYPDWNRVLEFFELN